MTAAAPHKRPDPAPTQAPAKPPSAFDDLDAVLREMISEHEMLLGLAVEHRRALASANLKALGACIQRQNQAVQRIALAEKRRESIVGSIQAAAPHIQAQPQSAGHPAAPITISAIAKTSPEPVRTRLLALSGTLRDVLNRLHREHTSLKLAAEKLATHVDGVMRLVCQHLSHSGTYARSGAVDASVRVVSALDVRT